MCFRCLALFLAWCEARAQSSQRPVALICDGVDFAATLSTMREVVAAVDLVPCALPDNCSTLEEAELERVVAVVGQPKDIKLLGRLPQLRLVHSTSFTYPRLADVPAQAVVAAYTVDYQHVYGVEPIAEFAIAAALHWNYRLSQRAAAFASCAWGDDAPVRCASPQQMTAHPVLMSQTMGVLGYGMIGEAVARRSAALGMRTVATKVHGPFTPTPPPLAWLSDDNDRLLRESDFVVVAVPGAVHGIINETALGLMKPGAVLIPISGNPVDFDALYRALLRRAIGGAVLDVWPHHGCWSFPDVECGSPYGAPTEPYPRGGFEQLDNALTLPQMAMRDDKFWSDSAEFAGANLQALVSGRPFHGVIRNSSGRTDNSIVT